MADRVPITKKGKEKLTAELLKLKTVARPSVVKEIETARAHGDLSENAEYHAAREKQSHLEGRILQLEDYLSRAEVIDLTKTEITRVVFGVSVRLYDEKTDKEVMYKIVGDLESDIQNGLISINSPIARALIGKEVGDQATVTAPGGNRTYEVIEIILSD